MTDTAALLSDTIREAHTEMHTAVEGIIRLFQERCPEGFNASDLAAAIVDACSDELDLLYRARAENARRRAQLAAVRAMHTESISSPCPVCVNGDDLTNGGDGTVPWPCPTLVAAGVEPGAGLPQAHREAHETGKDCGYPGCEMCAPLRHTATATSA